MSRNQEPINAGVIRASADLTWQQHQPGGNSWQPGTCRQCTRDGCPQLTWATRVRASGLAAQRNVG
ncbi:hypothetical protein AB0J90_04290 [Micromonospora sp. NPDC049523]|uniref:hypothetical protein n=1 Tax=unclassified Micromonospora TaxID=2617518 RepID=UPI002DD98C32|nr:hypothetical protein [Micromonospora sp. NBC_01796]WSA83204.1 hypothetical protein OIE47_22635 [Micromonospora sp. NBC_01796]